MSTKPETPILYGIMAEFDDPDQLIEATQHAYDRGYRMMEAYSPFPVDGLAEALGFHRNRIPRMVFLGGLFGGVGGFFMQWFSATIHYPLNIGGRPFNSWPAFIPITFELTILCAALSAVLSMLWFNGLPRPHHPVFNVPNFALASRNRFFLCLQARDPLFEPETARQFLEDHRPKAVDVVPW